VRNLSSALAVSLVFTAATAFSSTASTVEAGGITYQQIVPRLPLTMEAQVGSSVTGNYYFDIGANFSTQFSQAVERFNNGERAGFETVHPWLGGASITRDDAGVFQTDTVRDRSIYNQNGLH